MIKLEFRLVNDYGVLVDENTKSIVCAEKELNIGFLPTFGWRHTIKKMI